EANDQSNVVFVNEKVIQFQQNQVIPTIPQPLSILSAQLAIEYNDDKMAQWLRTFIDQKKRSLANNKRDEMVTDEFNDNENNEPAIANPPISKRKGRSETKRYKSSIEKGRRQPYACRTCGRIGHNSAR
ncbi:10037_t:CDS:2, partial [Racocetra fulgida]